MDFRSTRVIQLLDARTAIILENVDAGVRLGWLQPAYAISHASLPALAQTFSLPWNGDAVAQIEIDLGDPEVVEVEELEACIKSPQLLTFKARRHGYATITYTCCGRFLVHWT